MAPIETELTRDAVDAVRLVSGLLRRGEGGEALRERRHVSSWAVNEAGLLSPSDTEERGTAVRIRRERQTLLVARSGDSPEVLRDAIRDAARRAGNTPFFKSRKPPEPGSPGLSLADHAGQEARSATLAAALARALPDPRGVTLSLVVSRVSVARAVATPRAMLACGTRVRMEATGSVRRSGAERPFAFQSSAPWNAAMEAFAAALQEAVRPIPRLVPAPGACDVVFAPAAASIFWHEVVGHSLEADGGERGSVLARVRGAAVAPPGLDLVDDPTRADLPGSYTVDDEGTLARPVPLLSGGTVADLLTDRRSGEGATNGHGRVSDFRRPPRPRMANLVASPGTATLDELVDRCGTGLLVREIAGGSADPESGRFVLFVERADVVRRGKTGASVAGFALTGEVLSALGAIDATWGRETAPAWGLGQCMKAGDVVPVGGEAPALLVRNLTVRPTHR